MVGRLRAQGVGTDDVRGLAVPRCIDRHHLVVIQRLRGQAAHVLVEPGQAGLRAVAGHIRPVAGGDRRHIELVAGRGATGRRRPAGLQAAGGAGSGIQGRGRGALQQDVGGTGRRGAEPGRVGGPDPVVVGIACGQAAVHRVRGHIAHILRLPAADKRGEPGIRGHIQHVRGGIGCCTPVRGETRGADGARRAHHRRVRRPDNRHREGRPRTLTGVGVLDVNRAVVGTGIRTARHYQGDGTGPQGRPRHIAEALSFRRAIVIDPVVGRTLRGARIRQCGTGRPLGHARAGAQRDGRQRIHRHGLAACHVGRATARAVRRHHGIGARHGLAAEADGIPRTRHGITHIGAATLELVIDAGLGIGQPHRHPGTARTVSAAARHRVGRGHRVDRDLDIVVLATAGGGTVPDRQHRAIGTRRRAGRHRDGDGTGRERAVGHIDEALPFRRAVEVDAVLVRTPGGSGIGQVGRGHPAAHGRIAAQGNGGQRVHRHRRAARHGLLATRRRVDGQHGVAAGRCLVAETDGLAGTRHR